MQPADYFLSTSKVPIKDSLSYWNDHVCENLINLDVFDNGGESSFCGTISGHQLGTLDVCKISSQASNVRRTQSQISKSSNDYFIVNFQLSGQSIIRQDDRRVILNQNNWSFTDSTRPYEIEFKNNFEQLVLKVPRKLLTFGTSYITANTASLLDDSGLGKILTSFIYSLSLELKQVDVYTRKHLAGTLIQLLNDYLNLKFTGNYDTPSKQSIILSIKSFIKEELTNPELTIQEIAQRFKCSKRQLHTMFSNEDYTLNAYIRNLRLEKSREDIENLGLLKLSISEIGYKNGFNNNSNFIKCFKQKFGIPPGEYRLIYEQSTSVNNLGFH